MEIHKDIVEIASDLAHHRIMNDNGYDKELIYKDVNSDILKYKDDIQREFNEHYDFYFDKISKY